MENRNPTIRDMIGFNPMNNLLIRFQFSKEWGKHRDIQELHQNKNQNYKVKAIKSKVRSTPCSDKDTYLNKYKILKK